ncbi:penicillin acylase family protein [Halegenticoccus tardaugens]|uniref:penicillin acylase family protein n=1 Tax=Halegenticoccus tardaugens TaxID=2071624 RepID=UPI00100AF93E|nr:penicillin acylase family protein [Halegenticoccus tardaugens]
MLDDDIGQPEECVDSDTDISLLSRRQFSGLAASALAATQFVGLSAADTSVNKDGLESTSYTVTGLKEPAEILVDQWGVPHMYAEDVEDIAFVQGFNAARDRLWQIDLWQRRSLGKLSEALGEEWIEHDRAAQLFSYRADIDDEWEAYGPDAESIATGFANGVNAFIDQTKADPDLLPIEFKALDYQPRYWNPADIVRMRVHAITLNVSSEVQRAITLREFGEDVERVRQWLNPKDWEIEIPDGLDLDVIPEDVLDVFSEATMSHTSISFDEDDVRNPDMLEDLSVVTNSCGGDEEERLNESDLMDMELPTASNNWAIAPELTETGRPILANDPHRAHNVPSLRYIAHISAPEFDVIGAGEPGLPGISIGHNGHTAFGLTIIYIDQQDLYVYETNPDDPNEYRYGDDWEAMDIETETLDVRDSDEREVELKFTRHGPVIYEDPEENIAFAVRTVWTDPGTTAYFGGIGYMRAENLEEFQAAMEGDLTEEMKGWGAPPENQVAADTEGNIGWFPGGRTPIRPNWDGLFPVPGDGRYEWDGYLHQSNLPREINPDRGWVASANQYNLPDDYPVDDPPIGFEFSAPYRYQRISEVLEKFDEENKHSLADSTDLQTDLLSIPIRILTDALAETDPNEERLLEAREWLIEWDNVLDADSGEAALAEVWFENHLQEAVTIELIGEEAFDHIGTGDIQAILGAVADPEEYFEEDAVATRDELLLSTLREAIDEVEEILGDEWDEWEWGDLKKAFFEHALSPGIDETGERTLNVGPKPMGGSGYTVGNADYDEDFQLVSGASWRMVIDVGEWDNALAMNVPGQSGDPESPFYDNLLDMFVEGEYFPLLYTREAVQDACVMRINLCPQHDY